MKLHYLFVILPVLMILTAATTPSGTRQATCVVDVWSNLDFSWSPGRFTPVYDVVKAALCREMGPRAQEMLGIAPEALTEYLTFEPTPDNYPPKSSLVGPGSGQPSRLTFALKLDDKAKSAAQEFLDQMIAALPGVIDRLQGQGIQKQLDEQLKEREEFANRQKQIDMSAQILQNMGLNTRKLADIEELARGLDEQHLQLKLDVAAVTAQRDILAKAVDRINADADQKAQNDPVASELETIVKLKEQMLESLRALSKVGNSSPADLSNSEAETAEARVQLLERREAVERDAGGDTLADLRKQLIQVEVSLAEDNARLEGINEESSQLSKAMAIAPRGGFTPNEADFDDSKLQELQQQLNQIPKAVVKVVSEK